MPMGVSFSTAPVMPTTTTRSISTASSRRSVAAAANFVPMPVTMATTSRLPSVPECISTPPTRSLRSESRFTSGFSSIGIAQMNARRPGGLMRAILHGARLTR